MLRLESFRPHGVAFCGLLPHLPIDWQPSSLPGQRQQFALNGGGLGLTPAGRVQWCVLSRRHAQQ